jgi:hypothetical protein
MRIEWWLVLGTGLIMANIYTEGKMFKHAMSYKKYYQMAGVAMGGLFLYFMIRKNPLHAQQIIASSNEYLKYLPVDKNTSSMLNPILDFTSKYSGGSGLPASPYSENNSLPILNVSHLGGGGGGGGHMSAAEHKIMNSGGKGTKRSVSETKKKWVAAKQSWRCGNCQKQLPPWFEVDHKIRLEHGGSNHVDNLVALCRDCHGEKTAIENL